MCEKHEKGQFLKMSHPPTKVNFEIKMDDSRRFFPAEFEYGFRFFCIIPSFSENQIFVKILKNCPLKSNNFLVFFVKIQFYEKPSLIRKI